MSSVPTPTHALNAILEKAAEVPVLGTSSLLVAIPAYFVLFVSLAVLVNALQQLLARPDPRYPPVVFSWFPYIGSAVSFGANPIKFMQDAQKKYGDIYTYKLLGRRVTVCLGPDGNNFVFNGKANTTSAAEAYKGMTTPVFGKEVVYDAPHSVFMEQKKFIKLGLSVDNFRKHVPLLVEEADAYFNEHFARPSGKIDIHKAMSELIINTASRCLMGDEIRATLATAGSEIARLYADLDHGFQPINFLFPDLPLPSYRRRDIANARMTEIYSKIIRKRRASGDTSRADLVQALIEQSYKDGTPLPDHHIAHMMIAVLFGGQHTSATSSTWAILEMARNPTLVKALREEQIKELGSLSEPFDYDGLRNLPLLEAVVRETLRLHPPIFQMMRKIMADVPFDKTGHVVPKGDYVAAAPGVTQLDPTYFNDPMAFNPWRWINHEDGIHRLEVGADANEDFGFGVVGVSGRSPYLPFGAGRHRCIGEAFGHVQLKTLLGTFVRKFDFELDPKRGFPNSDYTSMVVMPEKPATILYTWRKN
ncbi:lanosterol 14-alpha demethylase [Jimgerdemannia flammicorona]|uniref:Lanosterol 14-alpha demethylase n=1 Tax=Jimgerdemannia flammicorona TaxID=994334 RepID=A0A433QGX3_9FUNG|nr:lanosterol 14-alpha demethylase [Jimgerdemannia flammicorona]